MNRDVILKLENVSSSYGHLRAVADVTIEVRPGELVTLVGANGAGKSTLLRCISGVQPSDGGSIHFDGQDLKGKSAASRLTAGISQVPEGRLVFADLSVEDNLLLGAYRIAKSSHRAAFDRVFGLFPILHERRAQLAGSLSGGQQQMLSLGRALMSSPKLLLLDEPSMGISPLVTQQIFEILDDLCASGVTILLVEQNANAALALADRGYVIESGRIVLFGDGPELLKDPRVREAYLRS
jgi:branched-chain amino acid transport system ATP-binding protein